MKYVVLETNQQASVHSSEAKQDGAGLTHSAKCYHAWCSCRSRQSHDNIQQSLAT